MSKSKTKVEDIEGISLPMPRVDVTSTVHQNTQPTPGELIAIAIREKVDIAQLEKLMDLQDRWEAKEAKKLFFDALARFQLNCPVITKNKKADFNTSKGRVEYQYATLDEIIEQIKKPLAEAELSYRFQIKENGTNIEVTCVITHRAGHAEINSMSANPDTTGVKNEIQSRGSTVTYLQRYTLIGSLGLGTAQSDVDGESKQSKKTDDNKNITPELQKKVDDCISIPELTTLWNSNTMLHKFPAFKTAISKRREAINAK